MAGGGSPSGRKAATVVEFRGRISQTGASGEVFTSVGYLIRATGARASDMFAGAPSVATALFTAFATGDLSARVLDQSVHSLDIVGQMTVYQRTSPGADFVEPGLLQGRHRRGPVRPATAGRARGVRARPGTAHPHRGHAADLGRRPVGWADRRRCSVARASA